MLNDATGLTLVLVRHGESTWNERRVVQGQTEGARLTERGRSQSFAAATSLRHHHFDAFYTSDLARALETAAVFTEVLGLIATSTPALRERSFGVCEGRPVGELTPEVTGIADHVVVDATASAATGESLDDLYQRVGPFVEQLCDESDQRQP